MNPRLKAPPFWEAVPLEELAELQQVSPVENLDELSDLWPVNDDPDELMRYLLKERSHRRQIRRKGR